MAGYGKNGNLIPTTMLTEDERRAMASRAGKASVKKKRELKTMREAARTILAMRVAGEKNQQNLAKFGVKKAADQNYQMAVLIKQLEKAVMGDTAAAKFLAELLGETGKFAQYINEQVDDSVVDMVYPTVLIPDNGRDKRPTGMLTPQAGPQTMFMISPADIVIYGGAAGGGKTYALLLEGLRHKDTPGFGAVIFRKNYNQITAQGGLWDASQKVYYQVQGANSGKTPKLHWSFQSGAKINFAHIGSEDDLGSWQGTEICYLAFDELTHFTRHQFLYMLSRNRSTCGVRPYVRATCNPDADSWVADFISWWIDQKTGYPIPERSGQMKWMCVIQDVIYWGDSPEELAERYKAYDITPEQCKSVTFIASKLDDNKALIEADPGYRANLMALTEVDMERLLKGNWKIKPSAGKYFMRSQIPKGGMLVQIPSDVVFWCRGWDLAATAETENGEGDYTSGVLMGKRQNGKIVVADVINVRIPAGEVETLVLNTAIADRAKFGAIYKIFVPQDPGQAGKALAGHYVTLLSGFNIATERETGSKEVRATPYAAQWQNGNVQVVIAEWNDMYFSQLESFPESLHDDMVDASSSAFNALANETFYIENLL